MAEERPPLEQLLDLVVFAPLGVMAAWREDLPKLAARGRREAELAKMIGRFAVQQGQRQVEAKLASFRPSADTATPPSSASQPKTTAEPTASPAREATTVGADAPAAEDLPIPQYDSLAASQVVARLAALSPEELAAVQRYETAHRARRTVLGKISQLQAAA